MLVIVRSLIEIFYQQQCHSSLKKSSNPILFSQKKKIKMQILNKKILENNSCSHLALC